MRTSLVMGRRICLLTALGLIGCDFLSTEPKGVLTTENFFKTADQAVQATNATYNMLREWQVHVFSWIGLTDIVSDDATKGSTPGDASFLGDLDNLTFDPGNLAFADPWAGYYKGIYRANVAIQNIPNVSMDATLKARLIAENKFLRAYYYFFLVRAFGGVPLLTQPLTPAEFVQARATSAEVYALIEQDLQDASASLPKKSQYAPEDLGRATKGAAQSMLAEAYLYQKDYPHALAYADSVIASAEYSLFADYSTLFTQAGKNSSEGVFEVEAAVMPGSGCSPGDGCSNVQYAEVQGVRGTPNIGWGFNTPAPELEAVYEPGDPRLEATILYPWELLPDGSPRVVYFNPSMLNNRYSQKVFVSPDNPGGTFNAGINIRRIRYADVLLIAAEAAYQTGDVAKATNYLNQVRARARGGPAAKTLGFTAEQLATSIAETVLGLAAGTSRVFVRYANPNGAAYTAGLRSFAAGCSDVSCASAAIPPVRVDTVDIIQSVNGTAVTTPSDYFTAVNGTIAGSPVTLQVQRLARANPTAPLTSQALTIPITSQNLLPDVAAAGQALLDAIWQERRVELAMEQQRWFDIRRQDGVTPGRAALLMAAAGKTFVARDTLYPIPSGEVQIAGLQQNPGY
jgi:hypothetical protein